MEIMCLKTHKSVRRGIDEALECYAIDTIFHQGKTENWINDKKHNQALGTMRHFCNSSTWKTGAADLKFEKSLGQTVRTSWKKKKHAKSIKVLPKCNQFGINMHRGLKDGVQEIWLRRTRSPEEPWVGLEDWLPEDGRGKLYGPSSSRIGRGKRERKAGRWGDEETGGWRGETRKYQTFWPIQQNNKKEQKGQYDMYIIKLEEYYLEGIFFFDDDF